MSATTKTYRIAGPTNRKGQAMRITKTTKSTGVRLTRVFAGFYSYRGRFTYHVSRNDATMRWEVDATDGVKIVRRMVVLSTKEARQMIAAMEAAASVEVTA